MWHGTQHPQLIRTWKITQKQWFSFSKNDFIHHIKFMELIWIYSICSCVDILFIHLFWFYGHKEALNMKSLDIFKATTYLNCTVIKIILATTRHSSIFSPLNNFTYYSHLRNSGPQNEALSYKTQHMWERQWHSLTFPSTHPSSFPTPLTTGSGQWAARNTSSKASAPGWSTGEPESKPPVISSSTGDHTGDNVSKWRGSKRGRSVNSAF